MVIGANTVVGKDVEDGALAVGVPARILPGRGSENDRGMGLGIV